MYYYGKKSDFESAIIEVHYWFLDDSHAMDALIQHKCEEAILGIIRTVADELGTEFFIETEPFGEGGLRRWFKVIAKNENKAAVISTALITAILTTLIIQPTGVAISKVAERYIENKFEDPEIKALEKKKLQREIRNIELDIRRKEFELRRDTSIERKKSKLYRTLKSYNRVNQISVQIQNENHISLSDELFVPRDSFKSLINPSDTDRR